MVTSHRKKKKSNKILKELKQSLMQLLIMIDCIITTKMKKKKMRKNKFQRQLKNTKDQMISRVVVNINTKIEIHREMYSITIYKKIKVMTK